MILRLLVTLFLLWMLAACSTRTTIKLPPTSTPRIIISTPIPDTETPAPTDPPTATRVIPSPTALPTGVPETTVAMPSRSPTAREPTETAVLSTPTPLATRKPTVITPPDTTAQGGCAEGCADEQPGCSIRGNVNSKQEKIYHMPSDRDYNKVKMRPEEGDRWFCTPAEAVANGFRHARQ